MRNAPRRLLGSPWMLFGLATALVAAALLFPHPGDAAAAPPAGARPLVAVAAGTPVPVRAARLDEPPATLTPWVYLPGLLNPASPPTLPQVYESTLTLNTYGWEQALVPTNPGDPAYPYPRLDRSRVGPPALRTYGVVVLENDYVRVTVLPQLGGRIIRWEDRTTGRNLTYANPVIKPVRANWGYAGWWMATGGVEWAFPVEEHGLNEFRPWQYEIVSGSDWRGVRVWDTDLKTGLVVEVTLRLYADRSDMTVVPHIINPTTSGKSFQFWINAMLALTDNNRPSPALRFWVPTDAVIIHSTGDLALPPARGQMSWPVYKGRDFSRFSTWTHYLGFFARQWFGAAGVYDEGTDQGVVRGYPQNIAQGVKLFGLVDLGPDIYTDDQSGYFEFWGGLNRTFWPDDYVPIPAGGEITWTERWYPVHGIGGLGWANDDFAASIRIVGGDIVAGVQSPAPVLAHVVVRQNAVAVGEYNPQLGPASPFRASIPMEGRGATGWDLQLWVDGKRVITITP